MFKQYSFASIDLDQVNVLTIEDEYVYTTYTEEYKLFAHCSNFDPILLEEDLTKEEATGFLEEFTQYKNKKKNWIPEV